MWEICATQFSIARCGVFSLLLFSCMYNNDYTTEKYHTMNWNWSKYPSTSYFFLHSCCHMIVFIYVVYVNEWMSWMHGFETRIEAHVFHIKLCSVLQTTLVYNSKYEYTIFSLTLTFIKHDITIQYYLYINMWQLNNIQLWWFCYTIHLNLKKNAHTHT